MLSHYKVTTDTVDRARVTPAVGRALADEILGERSGATDAPNAVTHTCQLPANLPCEDGVSIRMKSLVCNVNTLVNTGL